MHDWTQFHSRMKGISIASVSAATLEFVVARVARETANSRPADRCPDRCDAILILSYGIAYHWPVGETWPCELREGQVLRTGAALRSPFSLDIWIPTLSDEALKRLRFIRRTKALGFSLDQVRNLLGLRVDSIGARDRVRSRPLAKIEDVENKIGSLRQIKKALINLAAACQRPGRINDWPILEGLGTSGAEK
jgi:hypothetical protein